MDKELLLVVGKVAGIGGIGIGAAILIFRDIIRKNIFPNLSRAQAFSLLRLIAVLVWTVALAGIAAWAWARRIDAGASSSETLKTSVTDPIVTGIRSLSDEIRALAERPVGRVDAPGADAAVEPTLREARSYLLGFKYALALRTADPVRAGSEDGIAYARELMGECSSLASGLNLSFPGELPAPAEAREFLFEGIASGRLVRERLKVSLGQRAADAFDLAFRSMMAPTYLTGLAPAEQRSAVREITALSDRLGLARDSVDTLLGVLRDADASATSALFQFKSETLGTMYSSVRESSWAKRAEANTWRFASDAALAAVGYDSGMEGDAVVRLLDSAGVYGEALGLYVPVLPARTGERAKDGAAVLRYLLDELGRGNADGVRDMYGPGAGAALELAVKSHAMMMMYVPGDEMGVTSVGVIERCARQLGVPGEVYEPMVRAVESGAPHDEVKDRFFEFRRAVDEHLERRAS